MECRICSSETKKIISEKNKNQYYHCHNCDFIFKDPKHHVSEVEEKKRYEEHNNSIEDPRYVKYFEDFIRDTVIPYAKPGSKGLDFGSGPYPVLGEILSEKHGYDMDIYDYFFQPERIFDEKKYDLITCTEVLEHLASPMDYFTLFREHLNEGGILAMMTYFHPKDNNKFLEWHYVRDYTHISFFSLETFKYIAEEIGFRVLYYDDKKNIVFKKINQYNKCHGEIGSKER